MTGETITDTLQRMQFNHKPTSGTGELLAIAMARLADVREHAEAILQLRSGLFIHDSISEHAQVILDAVGGKP